MDFLAKPHMMEQGQRPYSCAGVPVQLIWSERARIIGIFALFMQVARSWECGIIIPQLKIGTGNCSIAKLVHPML